VAIEITDEDISYAERLLLPNGCGFNEERKAFIRCMESRDVVACPGSGKTTALLAKLLILARRMPFADGRGICVLTHTNVAIDKIRESAGAASAALFRYPNFFGTIQSFVNQYLATPWYRSEYKCSLVAIDNDRFFRELQRHYDHDFSMRSWLDPNGGLAALGGYWLHPDTLQVGRSLDEPIPGLAETTATFKKIQTVRTAVLHEGILSYNDAYAVALRYILVMPSVSTAICSRFCFAFLDETQDTQEHQFRVLDEVLRPAQLIIQRIGDPNQAIFDDRAGAAGNWEPRNPLHLSASRRYGQTITQLLTSVRLDDRIELQPCETTISHPPYLITYEDGEEQTVIPAFAFLVHELSDSLPPNGTYHAVGWIGKDNAEDDSDEGRLCIPTYFPRFDRTPRGQVGHLPNLISYAAYAIQEANKDGARGYLVAILRGVTRALDIAGVKDQTSGQHFTPTSVDYFWKRAHEDSYRQFKERLAECFVQSIGPSLSCLTLRDQVASAVQGIWPVQDQVGGFFSAKEVAAPLGTDNSSMDSRNRFVNDSGIIINVGTVHSVKGETHTGTLYLETEYYRESDAIRLIDFFEGSRPPKLLKKARHRQNLKIAHVAFSRPTHLLAFACRARNLAGHEVNLQANGWGIRSVSELTRKESSQT
jgi:DNA helicase-2/ATP-dependent DNA helicase PcrA